jgi:hypothetical protein
MGEQIMDFTTIKELPTTYKNIHESIYRSYHIVQKIEELLQQGINNDILLEIIRHLNEEYPPEEIPTHKGTRDQLEDLCNLK